MAQYRAATPQARAEFHRRHPNAPKLLSLAGVPIAKPVPVKSSTTSATTRKTEDYAALHRELNDLVELAGRAVARVRQEKEKAEMSSLTGLDKTRAGFKAQLAKSGLAAQSTGSATPEGVGGEMNTVRRSKPSQNPAFVPEPSQDVRLRQCNQYYTELLAEIEVEYQAALKAGRIPQELLYRKSRTQKEYTLALDKIRGVDVRSK